MSKALHPVTRKALALQSRGWSVVPCHIPIGSGCSCGEEKCAWPGKHPRVSWETYTHRRATQRRITEWFEDDFYGSNVGIVTGRVSSLVVVDVDGVPESFDALSLPATLMAETGGGGQHHFYHCDDPVQSRIGMVEGIDLKADGGFVVAPPSRHVSGDRYQWANDLSLAELDPSKLPKPPEPSKGVSDSEWFNELLHGVPEGQRSLAAAQLAGRYAHVGLSPREIYMLMYSWNRLNEPPLSKQELKATIRSVYRKHSAANGETVNSVEDLYQMFSELTGRGAP